MHIGSRRITFLIFIICLNLLLSCAEKPVTISVKVKVNLSGEPLAQATVFVRENPVGNTDAQGLFTTSIQEMRNTTIPVSVTYKTDGMQAKPWSGEIFIPGSEKSSGGTYELVADLKAFITIEAKSGDEAIPKAVISLRNQTLGVTDKNGRFDYIYKQWPENASALTISKRGYLPVNLPVTNKSGSQYAAHLVERAVIRVTATTQSNGILFPLPEVDVYLQDSLVGKTDGRGILTYLHDGEHGADAVVRFSVANQFTEKDEAVITLSGKSDFDLQYLPASAPPLRVGVMMFSDSTIKSKNSNIPSLAHAQFKQHLFRASRAFEEISDNMLYSLLEESGFDLFQLTSSGWDNSNLREELDILVLGNISSDEFGYLIDVRMFRYDGKLLFGHLSHAGSGAESNITKSIVEIIGNIQKRFPFEGTVTGIEASEIRINLTGSIYPLAMNDLFSVQSLVKDAQGIATGSRTIGALSMKYKGSNQPILVANNIKPGDRVRFGDKVTRIDSTLQNYRSYVTVTANSMDGDTSGKLQDVDVFVDGIWIGRTRRDGTLNAPGTRGKKHWLVFLRPGYVPVSRQVAIKVPGEKLTIEMIPQSTNFIVNSEPEGATVLIDGSSAGTTPMAAPVGVSSGLHTVVLQAPEGYFPWQQILDFGGSDINLTGKNTIKLAADFRNAIADQIKSKKIDDAISSLQQIAGDHPDYIAGQSMLAELYLDKKEDPSTAISHIEQALKAQQQNIQFGKKHSSIYVLLGKSYFSQASKLAEENIPAALLSHLKAIDALKKAQLSMRYFPKEKQKELTHDSFYYLALAYHNIYKLRPTELYLKNAQVAWQEFFDFYPKNLDKEDSYLEIKQKAEQLSSELTSLTTEPSHEQTGSDNPAPAQRDAPA